MHDMSAFRKPELNAKAATALLALCTLNGAAAARGGFSTDENRPDSWYIETLPPEVQAGIHRRGKACVRPLSATRAFARFIEVSNVRFIAIHFHALSCGDRSALCIADVCLHEIYVSSGGRYHLALSNRVRDVTLTRIDNSAAVEIACESAGRPHLLRWNGRSFVGR
jgi:hypothetical protein